MDAGSIVSFDQGWPQVGLDGIFLWVGCVEADVVVGFECAGFEFQQERRRLQQPNDKVEIYERVDRSLLSVLPG